MSYKDEKGILQTKHCAVTSFIRWRYTPDVKGENPASEQEMAEKMKMEQILGLDCEQPTSKVSFTLVCDNSSSLSQIESNTKLVEWSDGTMSLVIGDQMFEI